MSDVSDEEENIHTQYMEWLVRLQELTKLELDQDEGWFGRFHDGYSPEAALEEGPEDDDD